MTRIILFCGPPGCGKGIQGSLLAKERGLIHLSTGDIFREAARKQTTLGKTADKFIRQGKFVPDELVINLIEERLSSPEIIQNGVILDGFPRTERQARIFSSKFKIERLILFQISDTTCIERIMGRRVDPITNDIYHLQFMPPTSQEISNRLLRREYDIDEKIAKKRIDVYYAQLGHILGYFKNKIQVVNAFLSPQEVHQLLLNFVDQPLPDIVSSINEEEKSSSNNNYKNTTGLNDIQQQQQSPQLICTVCADAPADFLVVPCGHQCACEKCLLELQQATGVCPICRSHIQCIVKVFPCGFEDENNTTTITTTITTTNNDLKDTLANEFKQIAQVGGWNDDLDTEDIQIENLMSIKDQIQINIAPAEDILSKSLTESVISNVTVTINIPEHPYRESIDICCVVDVSGSMSNRASYENEAGVNVDDGLTLLDIVVHSVKSIIHLLHENDRLSIVSFSDSGRVVYALGEMTEGGKAQATHAIESLVASGGTNLWGGLLTGMDSLRADTEITRKKTLLLLTDGQPTVTPPRGFVGELNFYLESHPEFSYQLNTFGFGYGLTSELLRDLAKEGNGTFSFVPDARILGTCFINCLANAVTNFAQKSSLHLIVKNGCEFTGSIGGNMLVLDTDWGKVVSLGPLLYGQSRDVVIPLKIPAGIEPYLEVILTWPNTEEYGEHRINMISNNRNISGDAVVGFARCLVVSKTLEAIDLACTDKGNAANNIIMTLKGQLSSLEYLIPITDEFAHSKMKSLLEDVNGRITKAFNGKERFKRWGRHYLRAVARAHQIQQCTNYMDPGLQLYGSKFFQTVVEEGGKVFLSLPAPVKRNNTNNTTHQRRNNNNNNNTPNTSFKQQIAQPAPPQPRSPSPVDNSMNVYYAGSGGGCFGPNSIIQVLENNDNNDNNDNDSNNNNKVKNLCISEVKAGQFVMVENGKFVEVKCLIEIYENEDNINDFKQLVTLKGGLTLTGKHPIRINGEWKYPQTLSSNIVEWTTSKVVYNVVLESSHIMIVNGIECCTLGHGLKDPIVSHSYYGSQEVINNLQKLNGWKDGFIRIEKSLRF
eukprot:CAMPEP_0174819540 /NCGR_PEP_ID=MMETSP1107-20130205/2831_1 /TAXON_ID=36770 /ORGANISM="Paraphysomonas vestita, Strain GFlagA" /LENGTH=1055 /DNA_ID=CAMNT_0016033225 /DNA_START=867 /DNA_END=4034 /DNA_ORIENTATION=+